MLHNKFDKQGVTRNINAYNDNIDATYEDTNALR